MLGIGLTDRVMVTQRQRLNVECPVQVAVVREYMRATAEFAHEGLGVSQGDVPCVACRMCEIARPVAGPCDCRNRTSALSAAALGSRNSATSFPW